ncbi:hypothetical protein [Mycobacteroides abscessus]|uniref:hypothetical protein n=1 Tax=Mycobacteroides abscessus TaxID=36809 RepID=UPI0009A882AD|nr:hypothetical protein [Mycobacteroides abscessus]SKS43057.1 Uncharacterised protein [Mycobacteroides abscessus subsp. bolletii]
MAINLGRPRGPRLRELSLQQEKLLDAWLTMALLSRPSAQETMAMQYTRALATIARRRGIKFTFDGRPGSHALDVVLDRGVPGCTVGGRRKVLATAQPELPGRRVEPWNVHGRV